MLSMIYKVPTPKVPMLLTPVGIYYAAECSLTRANRKKTQKNLKYFSICTKLDITVKNTPILILGHVINTSYSISYT